MDGFMELPANAQIDPIPEGFQELPADVQLQPAAMSPQDARVRLTSLIQNQAPRQDIDAFLQSQGIDPNAVQGLNEAIAAAKQGRGFGVRTVNETPEASAAPETAGQALYRGVGDVAEGVGDVLGLVGNPLNTGINALFGTNLSTDLGATLRDATGAPDPITDTERYLSAIAQGGASGLAGAGLGALAGGAGGLTGSIARQVAANPAVDLVSGMTSGAGAEAGGDIGGTPGAIVGGLLGGVAGAMGAAKAFASRVPAAVALDSNGRLTPEAYDMAMRAGTTEGDVLDAYARARVTGDRRLPAERQAAREAVRSRPATTPDQQARLDTALADPQTGAAPVEAPNLPAQTQAITDAIGERIPAPVDNTPPTNAQGRYGEAQSEGINLTRGQAEQNFQVQNDENSLRASATNEGEQARGFFRQQQEQIQNAIGRFRAAFGDDAGNAADRGQRVKDAVRDLRDAGQEGVSRLYRLAEEAGGEALPLDTTGIRNAATDVLIDELVPAGVKKSIEQEMARYGLIGEAAPINEAGITKVTLDDGSTVSFRGQTKQLSAANAEDLRKAINRLYLSDPSRASQAIKPAIDDALEAALENATAPVFKFKGEVLSDRLIELRDELNRRFPGNEFDISDGKVSGYIISEDGPLPVSLNARSSEQANQVLESLSEAAKAGGAEVVPLPDEREIANSLNRARASHQKQRRTFNAKDIVENLIAVKKGTETDVMLPERAIAQVIGAGKDGVSNLRKVKTLLKSSATPTSRQAWAAIQHQGLADIFDSAISRNVNHGNGQIGDVVSGAKLNSAIEKFGVDKLRELLDEEQFNGLMKLRRVIGTATIPISGTVNPSGTATKIINYLKAGTLRFGGHIPGLGTALNAVVGAAAKGKEIAATRKTLEGILRYDGTPESANKIDQQAREFVRNFIDSGKDGRFVPTSINLTTPRGGSNNE